jgi:poly-gamma-glutamate capsule biosynthesis protein CapA/YwtB (metallophosphatase superfamily)
MILALTLGFSSCTNSTANKENQAANTPTEQREATADSTSKRNIPSDKVIQFAFTGDIMMGTTFPRVQLPADNGKHIFKHVAPIISAADIAAGNMEGTLCDGGTSTKKVSSTCFAFRTPTSFAPLLKEAGFDFLSMANNHVNDFGDHGLNSTMKQLDKLGIKYAGLQNICESSVLEKDGIRYGFCAFSHNRKTCDHRDKNTVRRIIGELKTKCDFIIVSFHGGAEGKAHNRLPYGPETFVGENRGSLRELAHLCIDEGANIVFGHGPHVLRAVEVYKGKFIAYSLGNFCTPYGMSLSGISGYAPVLTVRVQPDGTFVDGQIHSFIQQRGYGPLPDAQNSAAKEMKRLTELDMPDATITISENGEIRNK